jgi:aspartate ammonia-lyase
MKSMGTKQLMQDLQSAIKDLKAVYNDRNRIIEDIKQQGRSQTPAEAPLETSTEIK